MVENHQNGDRSDVLQILLADYENRSELLRSTSENVTAKVNTLLTVVSVAVAALVLVAEKTAAQPDDSTLLILVVLGLLAVVSTVEYAEMTQWVIGIQRALWSQASIRRCFLARYPELVGSIDWRVAPKPYLFRNRRTVREKLAVDLGPKQIVAIINLATVGLFASWLVLWLGAGRPWASIIGVGAAASMFVLQQLYSRFRYGMADRDFSDVDSTD